MGWLGLVVLIACFGLAGNARADISVGNAAFDDVYVSAGGYTYTITPWNSANEGGGTTPWISNGYRSVFHLCRGQYLRFQHGYRRMGRL